MHERKEFSVANVKFPHRLHLEGFLIKTFSTLCKTYSCSPTKMIFFGNQHVSGACPLNFPFLVLL